jgi:streptogramin lyase
MRQGWDDIVRDPDFKNRYRTGGLGIRLVPGQWHVWICDRYDTCHGGKVEDDMMCYAFNEEKRSFMPLGPNSKVKFVKSKKMSAPPAGGTPPPSGGGFNYTGSMNGSVGGMNGSEGSDNMNGSSCENVAGWVDSQNRTCEAYEEDGWLCETAVFDADAEDISAVEACCSCGGGWVLDSGGFNYTAVQEMVPDQDRVVLSWRHSQDLDLWVCDKSDLTECVGYTRKTAGFAGGTITLDVDITKGPGVETSEFRSVNSGTLEVWVNHFSQAFTSSQVLNYPATVYVYCYVCLDDDNEQKAGYVRSVTQNSDDVPDVPSGGKKWWKVGEFTWPSGSVRAKWTTCVTDCYRSCGISMNCSVGGMNGSEGSDIMNGSSCENVAGWVDSQNRTCEAYEEDGWLCETAVFDADAEDISAVEACCSCGGGFDYTPAPLSASFFDTNASIVRYPSSYSYAATYATRSLTPVPGYAAGSGLFTSIDISNTISSDAKYFGGVLGPNGLIYFVPWRVNNIGVLNPSTSSFTTIDISNTISSDWKYIGGVLGPNGLIYFVPYHAHNIGVLNPSSSSFTTIDISNIISSDWKYAGGVLGPNGLIYFVPINADNIGVLNPSTSSFTTIDISNTISSDAKYFGGVLGPNGLIYFVPHHAHNIGVLNPSSSSFSTIDISNTISLGTKYVGGVLGPNGLIYFVPANANNVGVLNPSTSSFTTIDISNIISWDLKYAGGVLGPNGLIYFVPHSAHNIGVLNPSTSSFTTIDISNTISSDAKYEGGVLGPNGLIYFVPYHADNIGKLHLGNTQPAYEVGGGVPPAWSSLLSPHFNKF